MNKSHLTNKESRKVFNKVIEARRKKKIRILAYQLHEAGKSAAYDEQQKRSEKFREERRKIIDRAPKPEGRLLTDEEALGTVSWWNNFISKIKELLKRIWQRKTKQKNTKT